MDALTDPRARFVGVKAYTEAGGQIERDLFQPEHEGYLLDPEKLDRLVAEKLEALAEEVRGEGWKWVEINPNVDYGVPAASVQKFTLRTRFWGFLQ